MKILWATLDGLVWAGMSQAQFEPDLGWLCDEWDHVQQINVAAKVGLDHPAGIKTFNTDQYVVNGQTMGQGLKATRRILAKLDMLWPNLVWPNPWTNLEITPCFATGTLNVLKALNGSDSARMHGTESTFISHQK